MPRNVYFSQAVASEQNLYEDLIIESLKIYGQDVYYLPRTIISRDDIFGEDRASRFDSAYMLEAYIENVEGFEGAGDLYQKFGIEIRDEVTFVISRRRWQQFVGIWNNSVNQIRPQEGDVLFLQLSNTFFEILHVEDEQPFYQLSDLPVYKLRCALYEYNDEEIDTGVEVIDVQQDNFGYQQTLVVDITQGQDYIKGETVSQVIASGITVYGEVRTVDQVSDVVNRITVSNIGVTGTTDAKDFAVSPTVPLIGSENNYSGYISSIATVEDNDFMPTDGQAQNTAFEIDADAYLDFTELNPFGDPSETN